MISFYYRGKDLRILLYVEVGLASGYTADVKWILKELEKRFTAHAPMTGPVDTDSPLLSLQGTTGFLADVGVFGWLAQTVRFDVAYAYSPNAQHSASSTEPAVKAVRNTVAYLQRSGQYCISAQIYNDNLDVTSMLNRTGQDTEQWSFMVNANHVGNAEKQNRRRSQTGLVAKINNAPFMWQSKATSVTFASERIGEAHTDMSSGTLEIYAAGNATLGIMATYASEEMGMKVPFPFALKVDNDATKSFYQCTVHKPKPKHIDCRQEWALRNCNLMTLTPKRTTMASPRRRWTVNLSRWYGTAPWWSPIATKKHRLMRSAQAQEWTYADPLNTCIRIQPQ